VKRLAGCERRVTVRLIAHLAEFDARRLYLPAGFPSLFKYCREVLRLSEHEAFHRILAARTARRFPRVMELLDSGALNLTTVRLLAPDLTAENRDELLALASGKGRREVEKLLAHRRPRADVPFSIRRLRMPLPVASGDPLAAATVSGASPDGGAIVTGPAMQDLATTGRLLAPPPASALSQPAAHPPVVRPDQRPSRVTPLAPNRYESSFAAEPITATRRTGSTGQVGEGGPKQRGARRGYRHPWPKRAVPAGLGPGRVADGRGVARYRARAGGGAPCM
jgi:hypothetical protein